MDDVERNAIEISTQTIDIPTAYDVIVIGGGVAGCAAALAARRKNKNVLLLEKLTVLGGLATTGHIVIYLPLDDGYGRQVIGGISEELLKLSMRYAYYAGDISSWKEQGKRYECKYNGPAFSLALEELLINEGIDILYDTLFVGSEIEDGICKAVITENKSGRSRFQCSAVIDASGDAEVFARANEPCIAAKNSLAIWNYCTQGADSQYQKRGGPDGPGLSLVSFGRIDTQASKHTVTVPYYGDTAEAINRFIIDGHVRLLEYLKGHENFVPASLPGMAQIRMARRIVGRYELSDKDAQKHFEDNIGGTGDWRKPGSVYEIPYRVLITKNLKNVLCAGRCISASGEAWEITRCIPQAALTGQAAGSAAVIAIEQSLAVQDIDILQLRETLKRDGMILDINT
ncbi:MAG: FAD-dependent oxidoreductase [Sphaerochaetaceae bacterium]|jgi:hypothetical protein|nr:FAD-dependent oxidoreductase [Spirochaetales bacterium]